MATVYNADTATTTTTPMPTLSSAPSTPLSLSFTNNFRLNSTDSMQSLSSVSYYNASPILRDFQEMSLALTDDDEQNDDDDSNINNKNDKHSLFVFCNHENDTTATPTPTITPTPRPISMNRSNKTNYKHDQDDDDDEDNNDIEHICSFKFDENNTKNFECPILSNNLFVDGQHSDNIDLSDDENDENPFLMGLEINIPSRKSSGYQTFEEEDILPEIESCDDEDEYSNNYFVDDMDCDELFFNDNDNDNDNDNNYDHDIDRKFMMKKYKYIKNIGIGAFGIVDKVFDIFKNKFVAIKQSRSIGDEVLKQFQNEFKILKEFSDCKYIINLIDFGRNIDANQICLGLEYMDIGSLKNIKKYTLSQIKFITKCILIALQSLHTKLYVHNDIKPENILISSDGNVKLIDFGCTMKMKNKNEPLTKSIGSIRYLSFEKRCKSPIKYNTKSDIYSFGVTLCEIFNGQHIQKNKTLYDHYFVTSTPKLNNNTNKHFNDFILKCIEKEPNKRWSAKQLLAHPFLYDVPQTIQFKLN